MRIVFVFLAILFAITTTVAAVTVQLTVFCNGGVVYDNAVTLNEPNPTAWDAIKASGVSYTYQDWGSYGIFLTSIAGCNGDWGPAFYVNGAESSEGVSNYRLNDGDNLQFIGPNSGSHLAGYLYLKEVPPVVAKGEKFRIKVMERSAYTYGGYDRPSAGATVTIGNLTFTTGCDGYTDEISLELDAYFCVAAEKSGFIPTYYFYGLPYIQCGIGGPYICSITGEGVRGIANIEYDEYSLVSGSGFSSCRDYYAIPAGRYPHASSTHRQKGSGKYNSERIVKQRPGGLDINTSVDLKYAPVLMKAYAINLTYDSMQQDLMRQKNYKAGTVFEENYYDIKELKKENRYNNSNIINYSLQSDFLGIAEFHAFTKEEGAFLSSKAAVKEELFDRYIGDFRIEQRGSFPIINRTSWGNQSDENESLEYEILPCCMGGLGDLGSEMRIDIFSCSCRNEALVSNS